MVWITTRKLIEIDDNKFAMHKSYSLRCYTNRMTALINLSARWEIFHHVSKFDIFFSNVSVCVCVMSLGWLPLWYFEITKCLLRWLHGLTVMCFSFYAIYDMVLYHTKLPCKQLSIPPFHTCLPRCVQLLTYNSIIQTKDRHMCLILIITGRYPSVANW